MAPSLYTYICERCEFPNCTTAVWLCVKHCVLPRKAKRRMADLGGRIRPALSPSGAEVARLPTAFAFDQDLPCSVLGENGFDELGADHLLADARQNKSLFGGSKPNESSCAHQIAGGEADAIAARLLLTGRLAMAAPA